MENKKNVIEIKNLVTTYNNEIILWDINLNIKQGILMGIVGPNGAGKSTLIKSILELKKIVNGEVTFFNKQYKKVREKIAYVPQKNSVDWDFPATVFDIVEMGCYGKIGFLKKVNKKYKEKVKNAIKKVKMEKFESRQIGELSGGQQQRIFLARALVQDAEIYIMDEPFQGVDIKTEKEIINILKELRDKGKTIIVVHHDLNTIEEYFDYVTFINGEIIESGPVSSIFNEENIKKTYKEK